MAQVENRLVANRDPFDLNGRRTVRSGGAGTDGTLTYDSAGSVRWTATYVFQTPNDLARAVGGTSTSGQSFTGSESRAIWLGRNPAALTEMTIAEYGAGVIGGPAAVTGCTSGAAETPAPGATVSAAPTFTQTTVGSTSTQETVTITNSGTARLNVTRAYLAGLNPGDYVITTNTATGASLAPAASATVTIAFRPTATGTRQANLSFATDAANTTDLSVPLVASTPLSATRTASAPVQSLAAGGVLGLRAPVADSVVPVNLQWTGSGPSYQLQLNSGSGWSDVLTNTAATSTTVNLRMGATSSAGYQFQVRACSGTTCSGWAVGPRFTLFPVDDGTTSLVTYKGVWTALTGQLGYYNATTHWATSGSATFTVGGNTAWIGVKGPDRGMAQVQVDGGTPQVVDMYADTEQMATVVLGRNGLAAGNHTVTITVLGKKSPNNPNPCTTGAKCTRVDFDMTVYMK